MASSMVNNSISTHWVVCGFESAISTRNWVHGGGPTSPKNPAAPHRCHTPHLRGFQNRRLLEASSQKLGQQLELLDFPKDMDSISPVKKLAYFRETVTHEEGKSLKQLKSTVVSTVKWEVLVFLMKTKATCRLAIVVSTCAFGGGDDLYQPIGMSEILSETVRYVAFWDEITLATQEAVGDKIDENYLIRKWRIIIVRDLPFRDQRLNDKIPKILPHSLFPNARYSIWVDSKSQFRIDPLGVLEALLWRSYYELAISEHGACSSVYDEVKAEVQVQLAQYHQDGLLEDKRFNGKKALAEASIIVRKHTPITNLFMYLCFTYVLWRLKGLRNINMLPICTRKDLVNSMGHIRKAKPLTN
ncbi:hypothetical protein Pfo_021684 [Paulownia fortunei]|nr:hypothetical protein Pfo_021684 [Paulownia fortunei]